MKTPIHLFVLSFIIIFISCTNENVMHGGDVSKVEINNIAGKLYENLTTLQLKSTNHLVIKGTLNSLDFELINDSMPVLTTLDLSNALVIAYIADKQINYNLTSSPANTIPQSAFENNLSIEKIILPDALITINSDAFKYSQKLNELSISVGLDSIKSGCFYGCSNLESIELPIQIKYIGDKTFSMCSKLDTINIPEGVTYLGKEVFAGSTQLESVYLPKSLINTQAETFLNCNGLIMVNENNNVFSSKDGVLYNKSGKVLIQCPISKKDVFVIPSTVQKIGVAAFQNCYQLTNVEIPFSVTDIEYYAFSKTRLKSIHIPSTVNNLRGYAFEDCYLLTSITIEDGITTISPYTFVNCYNLKSVVIPNTVDYISSHSFDNCNSLKTVFIPKSVTEINSYAFYNCNRLNLISTDRKTPIHLYDNVFQGVNMDSCTLSVPFGAKSAYQSSAVWKDFKNILESNQ